MTTHELPSRFQRLWVLSAIRVLSTMMLYAPCTCVCIYIYTYIYMYLYVYTSALKYRRVGTLRRAYMLYIHTHTRTHIFLSVYLSTYLPIYLCIYI